MRDYLLFLPDDLKPVLGDLFSENVCATKRTYRVSNILSEQSDVFAPEIDFYLRHSSDAPIHRVENVYKICDIRAALYDDDRRFEHILRVGNRIAIIADRVDDSLIAELGKRELSFEQYSPEQIISVCGSLGHFHIVLQGDGQPATKEVDQVVWADAPTDILEKKGVYDPNKQASDHIVAAIAENSGKLSVSKMIRYDRSSCLMDQKRHDICGFCLEICPTPAITRVTGRRELSIADVDCIGCGRCIAICPSGALEYLAVPSRESFGRAIAPLVGHIPLIAGENVALDRFKTALPPKVLPLVFAATEFLHEGYILDILQATGMPLVLLGDSFSALQENTARFINDIFVQAYGQRVIYPCSTKDELEAAFNLLSPGSPFMTKPVEKTGYKRKDIFAHIRQLVGEAELGMVVTGPHLHYGRLSIDENACTLCLSCADACIMGALQPHAADHSLRFTAGLCTSCGYCVATCPEKNCLMLTPDVLELKPSSFSEQVLVRDAMFHCLECGAEIGPAKSINKVIAKMKPVFAGDETKLKTLYCCSACKVKLMFKNGQV